MNVKPARKHSISIARVVNFKQDRLPTQFKSGFHSSLILIFITDTDHEVKRSVVVD